MKQLATFSAALLGLLLFADAAFAQRARAVVNPPGPFNRTVVAARGPGASVAAAVGGGRRNVAAAASVGGGFNASAAASAGGRRSASAAASFGSFSASAAAGRGFGASAVASVGHGHVNFVPKAVVLAQPYGYAAPVRVNAFGFTAVDHNHVLYETDVFGRAFVRSVPVVPTYPFGVSASYGYGYGGYGTYGFNAYGSCH